jgi:hypothetical protein
LIIGAKSALSESQLRDRKERGARWIEIQLLPENIYKMEDWSHYRQLIGALGLTVYAVHPPTKNSKGAECYLGEWQSTLQEENLSWMKKSMLWAQRLCSVAQPLLIVHAGAFLPPWQQNEENFVIEVHQKWKQEVEALHFFRRQQVPNLHLLLENNPRYVEINGKLEAFAYAYTDDLHQWVHHFNDSHVGTVLDICHAMGAIYSEETNFLSVNDYISTYAHSLQLLHLSKANELAAKRSDHGLPFIHDDEHDIYFLKSMLNTLHCYHRARIPITIETEELDYNKAENFSKTKLALEKALKDYK